MKKLLLSFIQLFILQVGICQVPVMVKDIYPGFSGSGIQQIVRTGNYTFFNAEDDDPDTDRGLYRTNGTAAGTIKLDLIYPGYNSSKAEKLTALGNKVIFAGNNSVTYGELWVSDGTQAGTLPIEKFSPTTFSTNPANRVVMELAQLNNDVLYAVKGDNDHLFLKKTDGTTSAVVKDFGLLPDGEAVLALFKTINGVLYFTLFDGNTDQLWRSDGTTAGTYILMDFGDDQFMASNYMPAGTSFYWMIVKPGTGNVLWKSDGTVNGTAALKTIGTTGNNNYPPNIAMGDTLFFTGLDGNGRELWKTDGTAAGTVMIADINTGPGNSNPAGLTILDSVIYFSAFTTATGNELFKLDKGMVSLVKDINPGTANGNPGGLTAANGIILFSAVDDASGIQLWVTDGSEANTLKAAQINPYGAAAPGLITPGSPVYFIANNGIDGSELFSYDNADGISSFLVKGGAIDLDGMNDFAAGTNADLPQGNAARTIEAWINPSLIQNGTIFSYGSPATNQMAGLHYINQRLFFVGYGNDLQSGSTIPTGTWTHVAVTFSGSVMRLYINGVLNGLGNKTLATSGAGFRIGSMPVITSELFAGKIDEVRIWNRSLTACEIVNDMHCELRGTETGLVGYYNFNQGDAKRNNATETTIFDHSVSNKNAQLYGLALTGFTSNWVYPGAVASGVSCNAMNVYIYNNRMTEYICQGDTASFIARPTRQGGNISYQWTKNSINIAGATDSVYSIISIGASDTIQCKMTQVTSCGTFNFTSNPEVLHGVYPAYTFTGNGAFEESSNWANNAVPPKILPSCSEIFINPAAGGECILNEFQFVSAGAKFTVRPGAKLTIINDLSINDSTWFNTNDSTEYATGLALPTEAQLSQIPVFQPSDSSLIDTLGNLIAGRNPSNGSMILPMPTPGDQEKNGSCAGWVVGYGLMGYYNLIQEKNLSYEEEDKRISPSFIWNQLNNKIQNQGLTYDQAMTLVKYTGMCKWADMPGDADYAQPVPHEATLNAGDYINETLEFKLLPVADINLIKSLVNRGHPIAFGAHVDKGFMSMARPSASYRITADGRKVYVKKYGLNKGQHAMLICGYDDNIQAFKVLNSWGTDWGNGGFIWINYDVFKEMIVMLKNVWVDGKLYPSSPNIMVTYLKQPKVNISLSIPGCQGLGNSALVNCTIVSVDGDPVKERGICYSKKRNPTTSVSFSPNFTRSNGSGTGSFSDTMVNLENDVKYYVRAYTKTRKGISYSNEDSVIVTLNDSTMTDPRDGKIYTIKKIGCQVWMTQNFNYESPGSWCYGNNPANCSVYGRLYNQGDAASLAPPGWHLPTDAEWVIFQDYLGGIHNAAVKMRVGGSSGFNGLYAGGRYFNIQNFEQLGNRGIWWSATGELNGSTPPSLFFWKRELLVDINTLQWNGGDPQHAFSVRYIRDY